MQHASALGVALGLLAHRLMFGLRKPKIKILGADIAGTVVAAGAKVTQFRPGDEVFGDISAGSWDSPDL